MQLLPHFGNVYMDSIGRFISFYGDYGSSYFDFDGTSYAFDSINIK